MDGAWYLYRSATYHLVLDIYSRAENANWENINFFQATINLLIGYEPPPNTTPNLNDQPDGDVSHADAGK